MPSELTPRSKSEYRWILESTLGCSLAGVGTGSSPVASGYSRVTETTAYASGSFGWTDTSSLDSKDRSTLAK